ncbi:hypothetical protein ACPA5B_21135, partial [Pseudomonas solani]|uniref:hypothetical protein n=1 Tax=Pseudomonas solani TaxID=2731552 RepID=UPI003C2C0605
MQIRISFKDSPLLPVAGAAPGLVAGGYMRHLVTFFISAFLFVSSSEAADYYWYFGPYKSPDPLQACKSAASYSTYHSWSINLPIPESTSVAFCYFKETYWGSDIPRRIDISRSGNSCPQQNKWDPSLGMCKPDPQNCPPGTVSANGETICTEPPILDANKGLPPTDLTCAIPSDRKGDPINISIGNKVQTIVDAPAASNSLISLTRT